MVMVFDCLIVELFDGLIVGPDNYPETGFENAFHFTY